MYILKLAHNVVVTVDDARTIFDAMGDEVLQDYLSCIAYNEHRVAREVNALCSWNFRKLREAVEARQEKNDD